MSYEQITSGVHQRPLGKMELIFVLTGKAGRKYGRELFRMQNVARVTSEASTSKFVQALQQAWKVLRLLHCPDIAATCKDMVKQYRVAVPEEVEAWMHLTFRVIDPHTEQAEFLSDTRKTAELPPLCFVFPQSAASEPFTGSIVLSICHWQSEASGAFRVMNKLFELASTFLADPSAPDAQLSSFTPGSEVPLLTPCMEDILMPEIRSNEQAKERVTVHFDKYYAHLPSLGLTSLAHQSPAPASTIFRSRTYTPSSTASLLQACNKSTISVTAAIQSAFLSTLWSLGGAVASTRSYACFVPIDVRRRLPHASPYRDQGCWGAMSSLMLTVAPGQTFLGAARELQTQFQLPNEAHYLYEDARATSDATLDFLKRKQPDEQASIYVTSIGVLDRDILHADLMNLKVESVSFGVEILQPGLTVQVWGFRGSLIVQVNYNQAFHEDEQIELVRKGMEEVIKTELGVELVEA